MALGSAIREISVSLQRHRRSFSPYWGHPYRTSVPSTDTILELGTAVKIASLIVYTHHDTCFIIIIIIINRFVRRAMSDRGKRSDRTIFTMADQYKVLLFLPRDAYAQRELCLGKMSVCPSVCPLHVGIVSKHYT